MKIEIDFDNKTITLKDNVSIEKLESFLAEFFITRQIKDWKIVHQPRTLDFMLNTHEIFKMENLPMYVLKAPYNIYI